MKTISTPNSISFPSESRPKILVADILKSPAQTLINTVNCVGIMGKGIALEFKEHFPEMFDDYVKRCERKEVRPGIPFCISDYFRLRS